MILPLTFLGGVFYSVSRLGSPWEQLSQVNPLFYVVETIRYGFLGVSDVSPWIAFAVVAGMCLALLAWTSRRRRDGEDRGRAHRDRGRLHV